MTISQGRVSVCLYYNILWMYNITYVLYMANSQGRVSVYITIFCGCTI